MKTILDQIAANFRNAAHKPALILEAEQVTYERLGWKIAGIMNKLREEGIQKQTPVGVITSNHPDTYATILALWFSNLVFVPLSPANPPSRNNQVMESTGISTILYSGDHENISRDDGFRYVCTTDLEDRGHPYNQNHASTHVLYILFTSGSTGKPKGVPITAGNLEAYVRAFLKTDRGLSGEDRFLQIFDFTFDVSVKSYVVPFVLGAAVCPVSQGGIKYLSAMKVLKEQCITYAHMVPSLVQFLRPHFPKIRLPDLRYSVFSGEALPVNLVRDWQQCVPNAQIENHYGPTEGTIDCLYAPWSPTSGKSHNGIVSIGKPYPGMQALVCDANLDTLPAMQEGELLISGDQLTNGYWNDEQRNREMFVTLSGMRYYRTGDIVYRDEAGDYFFCGRKDSQVQIQGHRVEPGEVEYHVHQVINAPTVVIPVVGEDGTQLALFVLGATRDDLIRIEKSLRQRLPKYMVPHYIRAIDHIPVTVSGKTDRKSLRTLL